MQNHQKKIFSITKVCSFMEYDIIIGLEIHAELKTKSKMFCSCDNNAEGKEPNTTVCPICLGHPGTLPNANKQAIEWTVLVGLALNCQIATLSKFDRKNYFYPDLPKGYQISQYDLPFCRDGYLEIDGQKINITRIHLEEDTGKLSHPSGKGYSLVDLNRAGTPLIEMVTEPVMHDAQTAKKFCQSYQQVLRYLNISNADMEKGEMRCEANVSVQEKGKWQYLGNCEIKPIGGYKLNPKVELKNINSFKAIERAIDYEVKRQIKALEEGEKLIQETRGWNEDKGLTVSQRVKETSADYRYFPEPDLPPIIINQEKLDEIKASLIELPQAKAKRFAEQYLFEPQDAELLSGDRDLAAYTEQVISELYAWIESMGDDYMRQQRKIAKTAANWLINELFKHLKTDNIPISEIKITPENFAEMIVLVYEGKVNSSACQKILSEMYKNGGDPSEIMKDLGLEQLNDETELEKSVSQVIANNPEQVQQLIDGKENVLQFLIGQVMAATKGKANPKKVSELLIKLIYSK